MYLMIRVHGGNPEGGKHTWDEKNRVWLDDYEKTFDLRELSYFGYLK